MLNYVEPYARQPDGVLQAILNLRYVMLETSVGTASIGSADL